MMSKNLFLVNLKKNMRRRLWLVVINLLVLFFVMPIYSLLTMGQYGSNYAYEQLPIMRTFALSEAIGISNIAIIITSAGLAIFAGISGFSYMFSKSKLDFYMSSPVNKNIRYAVIYINGILVFFLSYIINLLLALIIGASQYANVGPIINSIFAEFGLAMLTFFSTYNITIIAVMLTGNLPVSVLGAITLLFYPLIMCSMLEALSGFYLISYYSSKSRIMNFDYSPLTIFIKAQSEAVETNWSSMVIQVTKPEMFVSAAIKVLLTGIIFLLIGKILYNKKPAENCSKSFAFKQAAVIIKVAITGLVAICFGTFFYSVTGNTNDAFMILGLIIGILFGHCFMQVVINGDLKSTIKGYKSLGVSALLAGLIFATYKYDLTGFDSYIPNSSQVESASFYFPAYWWCSYYDKDNKYIDNEAWIEEHMKLSCIENAVIPLAEKRMPGLCADGRKDLYDDDAKEYAIIGYNMKNGRTVYRKIWFDINEDGELINNIYADKSFYPAISALYCDEYTSKFDDKKFNVYIQQGFDNIKIENFNTKEFFEIYIKDMEKLSFTDMRDKLILSQISGEYYKANIYMQNSFPIYESFSDTIAYLESKGYSIDYKMDADKVASMEITNYHPEMNEDRISIGESEDYTVSMTVTDNNQIKELVDGCYPSIINNFWVPKDRFEPGYNIEVRTKGFVDYDSEMMDLDKAYDSSYTTYSYQFIKGQVPQFVEEGTALY